jgi:hypothetical protein
MPTAFVMRDGVTKSVGRVVIIEAADIKPSRRGNEALRHSIRVDVYREGESPIAPTDSSQAAGASFIERLSRRTQDSRTPLGARGRQGPTRSLLIPVRNSYWLSACLPKAVLMTYAESGHDSLFQFHESFTRQVAAFLRSERPFAPTERHTGTTEVK